MSLRLASPAELHLGQSVKVGTPPADATLTEHMAAQQRRGALLIWVEQADPVAQEPAPADAVTPPEHPAPPADHTEEVKGEAPKEPA